MQSGGRELFSWVYATVAAFFLGVGIVEWAEGYPHTVNFWLVLGSWMVTFGALAWGWRGRRGHASRAAPAALVVNDGGTVNKNDIVLGGDLSPEAAEAAVAASLRGTGSDKQTEGLSGDRPCIVYPSIKPAISVKLHT